MKRPELTRAVRAIPVTDPDWPTLRTATAAALDGSGPALIPAGLPGVPPVSQVEAGVVLLLPTSGSTGAPKLVELTAAALLASAQATRSVIGEGSWLLTLPLTHIAGWQVVIRSILGGAELVAMPLDGGFDANRFEQALRRCAATRVSLVPTQLRRVLPDQPARAALARLDAVLVGGSRLDPQDAAAAKDAGIRIVHTYGMTETSGGCVYDGKPLPGAGVRIDPSGGIWLRGPMLARGYHLNQSLTERSFAVRDGVRWFRTADHGFLDPDGRLQITGRGDRMIISGGEKVDPMAVEASLRALPGIADALVLGIADPDWGQRVVALVQSPDSTPPARDAVLTAVSGTLGRAAVPQSVFALAELPRTPLGKLNRRAGAQVAEQLVRRGEHAR